MGLLDRLRGLFGESDAVHDDDPLPTSMTVPGAAAGGVWGPRGGDSELVPDASPDGGPEPGDDFLRPDVS